MPEVTESFDLAWMVILLGTNHAWEAQLLSAIRPGKYKIVELMHYCVKKIGDKFIKWMNPCIKSKIIQNIQGTKSSQYGVS
jgi:hypothetical protein